MCATPRLLLSHNTNLSSPQFIDYLEKRSLVIEVVGTQIPVPVKPGDQRTTKQLMATNFSANQTPLALVCSASFGDQFIFNFVQPSNVNINAKENNLV